MGDDCAALGLDAAKSIQAENTLEKISRISLAIAHKTALEVTGKALFEADTAAKARLFNLAARLMATFQGRLLTLQRLRTGRRAEDHRAAGHGGRGGPGHCRKRPGERSEQK
jgi:hypothetical protein